MSKAFRWTVMLVSMAGLIVRADLAWFCWWYLIAIWAEVCEIADRLRKDTP